MRKLSVVIVVILAMMVLIGFQYYGSVSADHPPPNLAGSWNMEGIRIDPKGNTDAFTTTMVLTQTTNPTLFYGTILGEVITIVVMDPGANMQFAISYEDITSDTGYRPGVYGWGTAGAREIVGLFSDDAGRTGSFTATKQ